MRAGGSAKIFALRDAPWLAQVLLRCYCKRLNTGLLKSFGRNGQTPAQDVEKSAECPFSDFGRRFAQWNRRTIEQIPLRDEFIKSGVVCLDEAQFLKIRVRVPPPSTLVSPNPMSQNLANRSLRLHLAHTDGIRVSHPFLAPLPIGSNEPQLLPSHECRNPPGLDLRVQRTLPRQEWRHVTRRRTGSR
jgi:hypothetical protein